MDKKIGKEFYHGDETHPVALTVGELQEILDELPKDLRIRHGFGKGIEVIVFNHDSDSEHLGFEELDENELSEDLMERIEELWEI